MVKWSLCLPSTPMIRVQIPLKCTISCNIAVENNKNKQKRSRGWPIFKWSLTSYIIIERQRQYELAVSFGPAPSSCGWGSNLTKIEDCVQKFWNIPILDSKNSSHFGISGWTRFRFASFGAGRRRRSCHRLLRRLEGESNLSYWHGGIRHQRQDF